MKKVLIMILLMFVLFGCNKTEDFVDIGNNNNNNNNNNKPVEEITESETWPEIYKINKIKLIDNSFYFKNFKLKQNYNDKQDCGYVANGILLSYYNTFYNSDILPPTITYNDQTFHTMIHAVGDDENLKNWDEGVGVTKEFCDYLYNISTSILKKSHWLTYQGMTDVINLYISKHLNDYKDIFYASSGYDSDSKRVEEAIKLFINLNIPVNMCVVTYYYYIEGQGYHYSNTIQNAHDVVVYGYYETSNGTYFVCHSGWAYENGSEMLLKSNQILGYTYINCSLEHKCSNFYSYIKNNELIEVCPNH